MGGVFCFCFWVSFLSLSAQPIMCAISFQCRCLSSERFPLWGGRVLTPQVVPPPPFQLDVDCPRDVCDTSVVRGRGGGELCLRGLSYSSSSEAVVACIVWLSRCASLQCGILLTRQGFCLHVRDFARTSGILLTRQGFCSRVRDFAYTSGILLARQGFCSHVRDFALTS